MNPLFDKDKKAVEYSSEVSSQQSLEQLDEFPYRCPDNMKWLCTFLSRNTGLCKKTPDDCDSDTITESALPVSDSEPPVDTKYGFKGDNVAGKCAKAVEEWSVTTKGVSPLHKDDARVDPDQVSILPAGQIMPEPVIEPLPAIETKEIFGIMTYNVAGFSKKGDDAFQEQLDGIRIEGVVGTIMKNRPDIVCFQGVSKGSEVLLKSALGHAYPFIYGEIRSRPLEVFTFSKYEPSKVTLYSLADSGSDTSMMVLEYQDMMLINARLMPGPGVTEDSRLHYSHKCRNEQLKSVGALSEKFVEDGRAVIIAGDFGFDLGGTSDMWPELDELAKIDASDTWDRLRGNDSGYTEDTSVNLMGWNTKFIERRFRNDGILYENPADREIIKPVEIHITGRKPVVLDKKMSDSFVKQLVPKGAGWEMKIKYYNSEKKTVPVWPADHFAVMAKFRMVDERIVLDS